MCNSGPSVYFVGAVGCGDRWRITRCEEAIAASRHRIFPALKRMAPQPPGLLLHTVRHLEKWRFVCTHARLKEASIHWRGSTWQCSIERGPANKIACAPGRLTTASAAWRGLQDDHGRLAIHLAHHTRARERRSREQVCQHSLIALYNVRTKPLLEFNSAHFPGLRKDDF